MSFKVSGDNTQAQNEVARRKEEKKTEMAVSDYEELKEKLSQTAQVSDPDVLEDIIALGFDSETVGVLPLIPLIAVLLLFWGRKGFSIRWA